MIEEQAIVTSVDGDLAMLQMQRQSTCSHCELSSGCGTGAIACSSITVEMPLEILRPIPPGDLATCPTVSGRSQRWNAGLQTRTDLFSRWFIPMESLHCLYLLKSKRWPLHRERLPWAPWTVFNNRQCQAQRQISIWAQIMDRFAQRFVT